MDIQKDYSCLERSASILSKSIDVENDFQEALPAYCDDIYRVVKCIAKSSISSLEINYNEVKIHIKFHICLTYFNENSNLCYTDFEEEISRTLNVENLSPAAFAISDINDSYTNFRVMNQRRIDVHSSSSLRVDIYDKVKTPCLCS